MKHCQLMVLILMGLASGRAQNPDHPSPPVLARAFETVDVVLARIADPLISVSSALSQGDTGKNQRKLDDSVQSMAHQWAAIVTVSNGKELPVASDLFFIYTEMLDLQSYMESVTQEERIREQPRSVLDAAVVLIKAQTELLPVIETLRYAAADRIDAEEARCPPHASGRQR
jgi:hypothetical protein